MLAGLLCCLLRKSSQHSRAQSRRVELKTNFYQNAYSRSIKRSVLHESVSYCNTQTPTSPCYTETPEGRSILNPQSPEECSIPFIDDHALDRMDARLSSEIPWPQPSRRFSKSAQWPASSPCDQFLPFPAFNPATTRSSCNSFTNTLRKYMPRSSSDGLQSESKSQIPQLPEMHHRSSIQSLSDNQKPSRPSSRPSMPPSAFWHYVVTQQTQVSSPGTLQSWQRESDEREREISAYPHTIISVSPSKVIDYKGRSSHLTDKNFSKPPKSLRKSTSDDFSSYFLD